MARGWATSEKKDIFICGRVFFLRPIRLLASYTEDQGTFPIYIHASEIESGRAFASPTPPPKTLHAPLPLGCWLNGLGTSIHPSIEKVHILSLTVYLLLLLLLRTSTATIYILLRVTFREMCITDSQARPPLAYSLRLPFLS